VTRILVAGDDGLRTFDEGGGPGPVHHVGRAVNSVAPDGEDLWAIVEQSGIWHAPTGGDWVHRGDLEGNAGTCIAVTDGPLVGTSEARLFRVTGDGLEPVEAFDRAEGRDRWYTPWGGPPDTRSMSEWGEAVYVNVHVGGILRTLDAGASWTPTIDVDADVHQVATTDGLVLAACAGGLATSTDRGESWEVRRDGLDAPYSRAVARCGDSILMSASNGPRGGASAVYRGDPAGGRLERCRSGLPEAFDDNIDTHCLDALPDGSFAAFGTSDGRVFASEDAGVTWGELASGLPPVSRVLVLR
jgi:hypothetical protein